MIDLIFYVLVDHYIEVDMNDKALITVFILVHR